MAMKKYTTPVEAVVFTGAEAEVAKRHLLKLGKSVSDFTEEEMADFSADLEAVREADSDKEKPQKSNEK